MLMFHDSAGSSLALPDTHAPEEALICWSVSQTELIELEQDISKITLVVLWPKPQLLHIPHIPKRPREADGHFRSKPGLGG
jgi:hypothetical protein